LKAKVSAKILETFKPMLQAHSSCLKAFNYPNINYLAFIIGTGDGGEINCCTIALIS
jgi:hypothetical protein